VEKVLERREGAGEKRRGEERKGEQGSEVKRREKERNRGYR
jgi:hypothetical protein